MDEDVLIRNAENIKGRIFYGWIIAFVSFCITCTAFGILYSFGVFFKAWIAEWAVSRAFVSGIFSVAFLSYGVASVVMGSLTDRYGPRKIITIGGLIMGAGCCLTALSHSVGLMYLTWGVMIGIGVGTSYSPTVSTVSRWFNDRKGLAVGIAVSGLGVGTLVFSPLSEAIKTALGWRATAFIIGFIVWIVYFAGAFIIRRNPDEMGLQPFSRSVKPSGESFKGVQAGMASENKSSSLSLGEAMKKRNFWTLFTVHGFWAIGFTIPFVHLVPYSTDIGVNSNTAAIILAAIGGASVAGRVCLGALSERIGTRISLISLLVFQAASMTWLSAADTPWMLWIFSIAFGFSYGGLASVFPLMTGELFGLRAMGSIFGVILLGATLGGTIGPAMAGFIFDISRTYGIAFLSGAMAMFMGAALASSLHK